MKPLRFLLVFAALAACRALAGPDNVPPMDTIEQVREITPEQADKNYRVHLRGVVTFSDWEADRGLFLQDETAGIYVGLLDGDVPVGEEIEVDGTTAAGDFVPMLRARYIRQLGVKPRPEPHRDSYEQLASGREDSQWVEVQGVIRSIMPSTKSRTRVDLMVDGQRLTALVARLDVTNAQNLVWSTVRVQGICRTRFNRKRQLRAPFLSVGSPEDIVVERAAPASLVEVPLAELLQFNTQGYYGRRVEVHGVVTEQKGDSIFIQDQGGSLYIKSNGGEPVVPGDVIKVVGFPVLGQYAPVLEDASYQKIGHEPPPAPAEVAIEQLMTEDYDRELVRIHGRLINRMDRLNEQVLVLEATNVILSARLDNSLTDARINSLQDGSELELTGVCLAQPVENWNPSLPTQPESFQLLLRSSSDVVVLRYPSWWTLSRLAWVLGIVTVVLLAGFTWAFVLDRRVRLQTTIIQQKIQREAVLEERTRIAREFHDTLEQELAAITIQLDTVAAQFNDAPEIALKMLDLARNMSRRSLFEARRSVWDLRSHLLENSNLLNALTEVTKLMSTSANTRLLVQTSGRPRRLAAPVENNLLRIAQEAMTNALKHSHATQIIVKLDYEPGRVYLRVCDDGIGFDTTSHATIYGGHFGLLDMSERAEKIGGVFSMTSTVGQGTEIAVGVADKTPPEQTAEPEMNQDEKVSAA